MPLLLLRNPAIKPYYIKKMNIRIYSEEELCYIIGNHPLMVMDGFVDERLVHWLRYELKSEKLAALLEEDLRRGDSQESMLLAILQLCDYYTAAEVAAFRKDLMEIKRLSPEEYLRRTGVAFFKADRMHAAYDKFSEAVKELDKHLSKVEDTAERDRLLKQKADYYCDMAAVRLRLFEDDEALKLLKTSELYMRNTRAALMMGLIGETGELSDAGIDTMLSKLESADRSARASDRYTEAENIFRKDSVKLKKEAAELLKKWKHELRYSV